MRTKLIIGFSALACVWLLGTVVRAQQPTSRVIAFQGVATTIAPSTPGQALTIQLWDAAATPPPGNLLFSEAQTLDVDATGAISFVFGSQTVNGLDPANFPSGASRFLDVVDSTGASVLSTPPGRLALNAVAFALSPGPQGPQGVPGPQGPPGVVQAISPGDASIAVGGTAANPTVAVAANGITNANVANGALSAAKIAGSAATLGPNTFIGNQAIAGNLSVSGSIVGANGLFVVDANGNIPVFGGSITGKPGEFADVSLKASDSAVGTPGSVNISAGIATNPVFGNGGRVSIVAGSSSARVGGDIVLTPGVGVFSGTVRTPHIRMGSETGTSQMPFVNAPPGYLGLVVRRINSTTTTAGSVVAKTDTMQLERDGTRGGLRITVAANSGITEVECLGLNNFTTVIGVLKEFFNPVTTTTVQLFDNNTGALYFSCSFGDSTNVGHSTGVTIRNNSHSNVWVGTLISTFNQ